jgi:RHS repeat-associated protein
MNGPYGEPNTWTGPRIRYTGQSALPEVSLYHYKARVYDPNLAS